MRGPSHPPSSPSNSSDEDTCTVYWETKSLFPLDLISHRPAPPITPAPPPVSSAPKRVLQPPSPEGQAARTARLKKRRKPEGSNKKGSGAPKQEDSTLDQSTLQLVSQLRSRLNSKAAAAASASAGYTLREKSSNSSSGSGLRSSASVGSGKGKGREVVLEATYRATREGE